MKFQKCRCSTWTFLVTSQTLTLTSQSSLSGVWGDLYDPIIRLDLVTRKLVLLSDYELINEAADDERFEKYMSGPLGSLRDSIGDGLFTGRNDEEAGLST